MTVAAIIQLVLTLESVFPGIVSAVSGLINEIRGMSEAEYQAHLEQLRVDVPAANAQVQTAPSP